MERSEALAQLAATHDQMTALVQGCTPAQLQQRPAADEWSLKEIAAHLRDAADIFGGRLHRMAEEDTPFLPGFDEALLAQVRSYFYEYFGLTLDAFAFHRQRTLRLLAWLDDAGWQRRAQHEELGEVTLEQIVERMANHERDHIDQMRRAKAALTAEHVR